MSEPFLGEVKVVSFNFAPKGWAMCNGQLLPINQNQALFSILGTTYGGDGRVNFALPNLTGSVPIHVGNGNVLGQKGGEQAHTLILSEMPTHVHLEPAINSPGDTSTAQNSPLGKNLAVTANATYAAGASLTPINAAAVLNVGGSQPHENMQPYLVLTFIIALQGIFPSQN